MSSYAHTRSHNRFYAYNCLDFYGLTLRVVTLNGVHEWYTQGQSFCVSVGIIFEAYSPLGNPGLPGNSVPPVLEDPVIGEIAAKHGVTPAQVRLHCVNTHVCDRI